MAGGFRPSLTSSSDNVGPEAEFLASEHIMAKRVGITLDAASVTADEDGHKIVRKGTLVVKSAESGKYRPYADATGDAIDGDFGDDSGFTFETVNLKDGDVIAGILLHGSVLTARVHGVSDAAQSALAGRIVFQ